MIRQKDIDNMSVESITQEFVDYYNRLSEERKQELAISRPDLISGVESWAEKNNNDRQPEDFHLENIYDGLSIPSIIKDDFRPVEALTISDEKSTCPAHRTKLIKYNVSFHKKDKASLGRDFFYCKDCNRLFIKQSSYQSTIDRLAEWNVPATIYDFNKSRKYLLTQTQPYELDADEKIYVPNNWVGENPKCPIHKEIIDETPCCIRFDSRQLVFNAFYCEECKKVILRRASMLDLEDKLAKSGIPIIAHEVLERKEPEKPKVYKPIKKPNYLISEGKRSNWTEDRGFYELNETDTIVVSDSIYCNIEDHDTEELIGQIRVTERDGRLRTYIFMLGYCSECEKYYMDEVDYKTLYKYGRPHVNLLKDLDEDDYMITSGQVFEMEKKHLDTVEGVINANIGEIKQKPDYVGQYETSPYYDDGLAIAKQSSKNKYGETLDKLYSYINRPYKYRVDIKSDNNKTQKYYVGSQDISLDSRNRVISSSSRLGRELIHYKTTKVIIEGIEYGINLSREFDINNATLYGYSNLRTDEDSIFRKGITDPFLVKALKMRKRKNDLTDIFVTIQENQNSIVDIPFNKNIIVQGCAGSGKTMVLLHRLSSLQYENPDFDFRKKALILTPNENFNLHIKGLAESLQVGAVPRASVEEYYCKTLEKYGREIQFDGEIKPELKVNQSFVKYVYSNAFRNDFYDWYEFVIEERNKLAEKLYELQRLMREERSTIDLSNDSKVNTQISSALYPLNKKIDKLEKQVEQSYSKTCDVQERKAKLLEEIPKQKTILENEIESSKISINQKIALSIREKAKIKGENEKKIETIVNELENLQQETNISIEEESFLNDFLDKNKEYITDEIKRTKGLIDNKKKGIELLEGKKRKSVELSNVSDYSLLSGVKTGNTKITEIQTALIRARRNLELAQEALKAAESGINPFGKQRKINTIQEEIDACKKTIESNTEKLLEERDKAIKSIETSQAGIDKINSEIKACISSICIMISDRRKIKERTLKGQVTKLQNEIERYAEYIIAADKLIEALDSISLDKEFFAWLSTAIEARLPVGEENRRCRTIQFQIEELERESASIDERIEEAHTEYKEALNARYSEKARKLAAEIKKELGDYSDIGVYRMVFENACSTYPNSEHIPKDGLCRRYDLYARLLFAKRYYGKNLGGISYMCVDEGQDISLNEYKLIKEINDAGLVMNIFGDTNQLIKTEIGIGDWNSIRRLISVEMFTLNENYRNTNQITRFCNESFDMNVLQTGVDGVKVREITRKEFDNELAHISVENDRVAILVPRSISKNRYIHKEILSEDITSVIGEEIDNGRISLMYVDEVKGIEFDKVFVVSNDMSRNERYIAYTRALSELIIVVDNELN